MSQYSRVSSRLLRHPSSCFHYLSRALFVVCLDDTSPENEDELCSNFLCGTYRLSGGEPIRLRVQFELKTDVRRY